ncbi:acyl-CoA dehydrogenase family protein [Rhodococcus koreensis]|uniref:Acyl-[acyl-carrier-protein] dehydrogenase MbtN n=1 Tax=Rhodococcus koreensis TaxID=99653 RepID=A0A1H4L011_9NOCA|nr:acyl-CoA dehydrogenase family protein [Rhodococcus koreensis]SEB63512.1 acyl-CoA dehydrogenase [Rhodococcus koreensis]
MEADEVRDVASLARTFFTQSVLPHQERFAEQHRVDAFTWQEAGRLGLLLPSVPEDLGGGGGTFAHEAAVLWEQGRTGDDSLAYAIHSTIVPHYLVQFGTPEQQRLLPQLAAGELVGAIAMTEPDAGSDLKMIRTTARKAEDGWVLNGSKTFITNGSMAGVILVVARTGGPGSKGLSLFAVETKDLEGFSYGKPLRKIGQQGQDTRELFFDDVSLPVGALVGDEGAAFAYLMQQLPQERLAIAIGAVAQAELAVELAIERARQREAFGATLWDLPSVRHEVAACATDVLRTRTFLDHCIEEHGEGRLDSPLAAQIKLASTEMLSSVADRCLQVFGGYGYILDYPIARIFAGARVQRIYGGANEVMKEVIARAM